MSIIIQNMGWTYDQNGKSDDCHYALRINHKTLTHFVHSRQEGLAVCLRKAADAIDKGEMKLEEIPYQMLSNQEKVKHRLGDAMDDSTAIGSYDE